MAMIQCSECGKEISDKARECIHCGKVFVEEEIMEQINCSECGAVLEKTDKICPNCGCPVETQASDDVKPHQVEVTSIRMAKKIKKIIIGMVIAVSICLVGGIVYKVYSDKQAEQEYKEEYNEYISTLEQVQGLMVSGRMDSESLCNLTLKVWRNAIYEDSDDTTDKYTQSNGYFVDDFSEAVSNLYLDSETQKTLLNIKANQSATKYLIKKLQNPPEGLDECHNTVTDLYKAYRMLTDLAISPSGNYNEFRENKSNAVSDFISAAEKLDTQIPDKIKTK